MNQDQMNKIYSALVSLTSQNDLYREEINQIYEILRTSSESYDDFYENSRESYVSFVNFAPSVQQAMQEVELWHQQ